MDAVTTLFGVVAIIAILLYRRAQAFHSGHREEVQESRLYVLGLL